MEELAAVDWSEVYEEHKQKLERLKPVEMLCSVSHMYVLYSNQHTQSIDIDVNTQGINEFDI